MLKNLIRQFLKQHYLKFDKSSTSLESKWTLKTYCVYGVVKFSIDWDEDFKNQLIKKYMDKIKALSKFSSEKADEFTKQFSEELEIKVQSVKKD